jgi:RNA polymerase sigma factor (sigma-70 family)
MESAAAPDDRSKRLMTETLIQKCLPALNRWAHGRLPAAARGRLDTRDLVQEAVLHLIARSQSFEPTTAEAALAYLRKTVLNLVRDEARRLARRPATSELTEDAAEVVESPLDALIQRETFVHYRRALHHLKPRDRRLIVASLEYDWSVQEIAARLSITSVAAARVALARALQRLGKQLALSAGLTPSPEPVGG